ncbi:MAG: hypothetical protein AAB353_04180, partial [Candidatus Hydrogenedentota bacterium]
MNYVRLSLIAFAVCAKCLAAPELTVQTPEWAVAGKPFSVGYRFAWPVGESWVVVPPAEVIAEGFEAIPGKFEATAADGEVKMSFLLNCLAGSEGAVTVPELSFSYFDPSANPAKEPASETTGIKEDTLPKLMSEPITIVVKKSFPWLVTGVGAIGVIFVLFIVSFVVWRARKGPEKASRGRENRFGSRKNVVKSPSEAGKIASEAGEFEIDLARIQSLIHRAKQHRLDGNYYNTYKALYEVLVLIPGKTHDRELARRLEVRAKEVGFQGVRP